MNCQICKKSYWVETDFTTFFREKFICKSCQKLLDLPVLEMTIPIESGALDFMVMYPGTTLSPELETSFAQKYVIGLIHAITSNPKYNIVLYFEDIEILYFEQWFPYVRPFSKILFLSLTDVNFETSVMFR